LSSRPAEDFILGDRNSIAVMNFSQDSARGIGTEFLLRHRLDAGP